MGVRLPRVETSARKGRAEASSSSTLLCVDPPQASPQETSSNPLETEAFFAQEVAEQKEKKLQACQHLCTLCTVYTYLYTISIV